MIPILNKTRKRGRPFKNEKEIEEKLKTNHINRKIYSKNIFEQNSNVFYTMSRFGRLTTIEKNQIIKLHYQ